MLHRKGKKYSFKKKSNNQENPKSPEPTRNGVTETRATNKKYPAREEPLYNVKDKMT